MAPSPDATTHAVSLAPRGHHTHWMSLSRGVHAFCVTTPPDPRHMITGEACSVAESGRQAKQPQRGTKKEGSAMTGQAASHYSSAGHEGDSPSGWAVGFILFAGVMMLMAGAFQAMAGLVALFENEFYVTTRNYVFQLDATGWGWIH